MNEVLQDLHFPRAGLNVVQAFSAQPNRPTMDGVYARTTPAAVNVRGFEVQTGKNRGGSRVGLSKYIATQVNGVEWVVQDLRVIVGTYAPPGGNMQTSQSGRVVTVVAVSQGQVKVANAGDTVWSPVVNSTGNNPPLNFSGIMYSTSAGQKLYFADGTNWVTYTPSTNTLTTWAATAGTLPVDSDGNTPRLICTWRGRVVLSGLLKDPQNWFMSRVNAPTDFDYAPASPSPDQAVAGNNAPMGLIGDVVTALIPYTDDLLIVGGDHTIWMFRGDPMAGGQIDSISDSIGIAWGQAWCKDPYGTIYFFSNKCGIYAMFPGQPPQRISQQIEPLLADVNTGSNIINLEWDDRWQGFHVFITDATAPAATTHYFYEQRNGAWWQDTFANNDFNPLCSVTFDGNLPGDRAVLVGCWDGFVRFLDPTVTKDDGLPIASSVVIGPMLTKDLDDILLKNLQGNMGTASGDVTYSVFVGATAEAALASAAAVTGTWVSARNLSNFIRRSGHAVYVKIATTNPWAMESIRAEIVGLGKVRRRGK